MNPVLSFALPAELTRETARQLRRDLLQRAQEGGAWALDGANVLELDAVGLQILLSFSKSLQQRGGRVSLKNPSAPLARAIEVTGTAEWFREGGAP